MNAKRISLLTQALWKLEAVKGLINMAFHQAPEGKAMAAKVEALIEDAEAEIAVAHDKVE